MYAAITHLAALDGDRSLCDDVLPLVLRQLDSSSTAQLRRTSKAWKGGVECKLQHLEPRCKFLDVLQLFSGLQSVSLLRLSDSIFTSCTRLRHLRQLLQPWAAQLEQQQHLTSITIGLQQAQSMGQIAWAHWLYHDTQPAHTAGNTTRADTMSAGTSSSSSSSDGTGVAGTMMCSSGGSDVQPIAHHAANPADVCQGDHPSVISDPAGRDMQQAHAAIHIPDRTVITSASSYPASQARNSNGLAAGSPSSAEVARTSGSGGGRSSSSSTDIDHRQRPAGTTASTISTCSSSSGGGGGGSTLSSSSGGSGTANPAPARAASSSRAPLLPQWYKGPYAALMHTERHVVLYVPSAFAAAGITHLVLKPPHPGKEPGCSTAGTATSSSSNNSGTTSSSTSSGSSGSSGTTTTSSSSSSSSSSRRCITPSWSELPCCLFLGAKHTRLESLEVHGAKLLVLPPCLQRMGGLKRLVLEGCQLQLSKDVFKFTQLQELRLAHNSMVELVDGDWGRLCRLQVLDLSHNQLKDLPASLAQAPALHTVLLHHNQLPALPGALGRLQQLRHLDASHNWLSGAQELSALLPCWPRLQRLHLRNVSSKLGALALPAAVVGCRELEVLDVGDQFDLCWSSLGAAAGCKALQVVDITPLPRPSQQAVVAEARQALLQMARQAPWLRASVGSSTRLQELVRQLSPGMV